MSSQWPVAPSIQISWGPGQTRFRLFWSPFSATSWTLPPACYLGKRRTPLGWAPSSAPRLHPPHLALSFSWSFAGSSTKSGKTTSSL